MKPMGRPTDAVKTALGRRLQTHRAARWPQLTELKVRFRGEYAYIDADEDGDVWPLCRLRYTGNHDAAANPSASRKRPSTAPAACTSATPPPGPDPSRINAELH
jgi:hypothetical protein